jgi:CBS domain-containing protein
MLSRKGRQYHVYLRQDAALAAQLEVDGAVELGGVGMVARSDLLGFTLRPDLGWLVFAAIMTSRPPVVAYPDEPLFDAAERMLAAGVGRLPVVLPDTPNQVVGMLSRSDVLKALADRAEQEHQRERLLGGCERRQAG